VSVERRPERRLEAATKTTAKKSSNSVPRTAVFEDDRREAAFRHHQKYQERCPYTSEELGWRTRRRRGRIPPRLLIRVTTAYTAEIEGTFARDVLDRAGCPKQFQYRPASGAKPCWTAPAWAVRDIVAAAESMNGSAQVEDAMTLWDAS
jgi:hypothetical protein